MARRTVGRILGIGALFGLLATVPIAANAAGGAAPAGNGAVTTAAPSGAADTPFDGRPLILLLIAGGLGSMGALSREPAKEDGIRRP